MFSNQTNLRNYSNGLLKRTKKIQKNADSNIASTSKNIKIKSIMEIPKLTDLKSFITDETNQFKKIKERTSQMIKFDSILIKKTFFSLKNYCEKKMLMEPDYKTEIFIEINFDKKPQKVPLKCMKM